MSSAHHWSMTPTSPLAGVVTGLVDGLVITLVVMLVVLLNNRRHRVAQVRPRSASLDGASTARSDDVAGDGFHRAA